MHDIDIDTPEGRRDFLAAISAVPALRNRYTDKVLKGQDGHLFHVHVHRHYSPMCSDLADDSGSIWEHGFWHAEKGFLTRNEAEHAFYGR
jgi:hypothetical protein